MCVILLMLSKKNNTIRLSYGYVWLWLQASKLQKQFSYEVPIELRSEMIRFRMLEPTTSCY
jgi:hypothetical protein